MHIRTIVLCYAAYCLPYAGEFSAAVVKAAILTRRRLAVTGLMPLIRVVSYADTYIVYAFAMIRPDEDAKAQQMLLSLPGCIAMPLDPHHRFLLSRCMKMAVPSRPLHTQHPTEQDLEARRQAADAVSRC